jgi:protein PhnA
MANYLEATTILGGRRFDCCGMRRAVYCPPFYSYCLTRKDHTMSAIPPCPQCNSEFTYEDGGLTICPECAHEWPVIATAAATEDGVKVYRDSAGNVLQDGDTVTVIKDLKLKGSAGVVKMGTKVKNIRLVDSDHDIDCKIDGFGAMSLKTEFVKKV